MYTTMTYKTSYPTYQRFTLTENTFKFIVAFLIHYIEHNNYHTEWNKYCEPRYPFDINDPNMCRICIEERNDDGIIERVLLIYNQTKVGFCDETGGGYQNRLIGEIFKRFDEDIQHINEVFE